MSSDDTMSLVLLELVRGSWQVHRRADEIVGGIADQVLEVFHWDDGSSIVSR